MSKLDQDQIEQILLDLQEVVQIMKGNDLSSTETNIKVMFKKMKEIIDTGSFGFKEPTEDEKQRIAQEVVDKILPLLMIELRAKGLIT